MAFSFSFLVMLDKRTQEVGDANPGKDSEILLADDAAFHLLVGEVDGLEAGHVQGRRRGEHGLPVRHCCGPG